MIGKNNILNIRTSSAFKWNGQTGATKGFCDFESLEMCRRAGAYLLMRSYRKAGANTLDKIICRWAPTSENDTASYLHFVCKTTGFKASQKMYFDSDYACVLAAMEIIEDGIAGTRRITHYESAKRAYMEIIETYKLKRYED